MDILVIGAFFVEIHSYAIASLCYANSTSGNSMGLILDARGSFLKAHSLWNAETATQGRDTNSRSFLNKRYCSGPRCAVSEALSKELD